MKHETRHRLIHALADGRFHSGPALGGKLGLSRAAVWQQLQRLPELGLEVWSVRGKGYRLSRPLSLLREAELRAELERRLDGVMHELTVLPETDSTNQRLLAVARDGELHGRICLAEFQRAGRGRQGRSWQMPYGRGLCLSVGWHYPVIPPDLPALPLAIGVVARELLASLGLRELALKWPNDLVCPRGKLGGILVENRMQHHGPIDLVVGIGINVQPPLTGAWRPEQPAADLESLLGRLPDRTSLAVQLSERLMHLLQRFPEEGFASYLPRWERMDWLRDRPLRVQSAQGVLQGHARGVDPGGALLLETSRGLRRVLSGEVRVRVDHAAG